jgi:hypothetical protein
MCKPIKLLVLAESRAIIDETDLIESGDKLLVVT